MEMFGGQQERRTSKRSPVQGFECRSSKGCFDMENNAIFGSNGLSA